MIHSDSKEHLKKDKILKPIVEHFPLSLNVGNNDVFDETALEAIANASNGIPRIINKICDSSLMIGNTKNVNIINSDMIMLAVNEIELG